MKKFLLLLLASAFLLCACGETKKLSEELSCDRIFTAAKQACTAPPEAENFYSDAEENLDSYALSLFADGVYAECEEYELLNGYALYLSGGATTFEIDVLKASDEAGAQRLCGLLQRRIATLNSGDKAMYDPDFSTRMKEAQVYTDGVFAILLLTADNAACRAAIDELK